MEELLIYALLFYEEFVTENEYSKRLDELFLNDPENDDLLYLEWETDIKKTISYMKTHIDYKYFDIERFSRILISTLKVIYINCSDMKCFASRMYSLWKGLPDYIQKIEPFWILCYAGDPLSYGGEERSRTIYEHMLSYYKN